MTECNPPKIRSLIEKHLGKAKAEEYDTIVEQCKLGQALKDDRVWASLCPSYPNLKGVTCEEIESFLDYRLPEFFKTQEYQDIEHDALKHTGVHERGISYEEEKDEFLSKLEGNIPEKYMERMRLQSETCVGIDTLIGNIGIDKHNKPTQKLAKEYLHHVKVYNRDEEYAAFKKIGKQIENDSPGTIHDPSTIFVTTPRGGHEMLSIFAYANDIEKRQIPSDITWRHVEQDGYNAEYEQYYRENPHGKAFEDIEYDTEIYGKTWLNNTSDDVKNIFVVDDIIASGEQIHRTYLSLKEMFPNAEINSITLCKRERTSPPLPQEIDNYYTDTTTTGINVFKDHMVGDNLKMYKNKYITCSFPHCCPDGTSDKLMVELMGDKRCSPEKRISRRDL